MMIAKFIATTIIGGLVSLVLHICEREQIGGVEERAAIVVVFFLLCLWYLFFINDKMWSN